MKLRESMKYKNGKNSIKDKALHPKKIFFSEQNKLYAAFRGLPK